jgi:hypothetical protein
MQQVGVVSSIFICLPLNDMIAPLTNQSLSLTPLITKTHSEDIFVFFYSPMYAFEFTTFVFVSLTLIMLQLNNNDLITKLV